MTASKTPSIRTLAQARAYLRRVGICGIFSDIEGHGLWSVVDLPGRKAGQKGWGEKVTAIWTWKCELPYRYPGEFFYGKIPGGLAALMTIDHLRKHYAESHRPIEQCSPLAQKLYRLLRLDPLTTTQVRKELDAPRNQIDRALVELQTTLNIARRNAPSDARDTWIPFREQYLDIVRPIPSASAQKPGGRTSV